MFYAVTFNEIYQDHFAFLVFLSMLRTPGVLFDLGCCSVFLSILRTSRVSLDLEDFSRFFSILYADCCSFLAFFFDLEDSLYADCCSSLVFLSILRTSRKLIRWRGVLIFAFFSILRTPGMLGVVAFRYFSRFFFDLEDFWCFFSILRTPYMLIVVAFRYFSYFFSILRTPYMLIVVAFRYFSLVFVDGR
ncbi:hypothetical protein RhiirC2_707364 [Rhizophagus irregularis]|uniref:Uncharacterized protein n=1 Tax=Rhizophagus irregularis TaxID=588596 RepID=A0A2N1NRH9_9GLOM|nr:hypothetical protein RhiirC2_707364 [Rhizophagus irregularis]